MTKKEAKEILLEIVEKSAYRKDYLVPFEVVSTAIEKCIKTKKNIVSSMVGDEDYITLQKGSFINGELKEPSTNN